MKLITITALFFSAAVASANCPDLSGRFTCETANGKIEIEMTQAVENGVTTYQLNDGYDLYIFPATNVEQPYEDKESNVTGSVRITCENDGLSTYQKAEAKDQAGNVVETLDVLQIMKRDEAKNLVITSVGKQSSNGQESPINDSFVCKVRN